MGKNSNRPSRRNFIKYIGAAGAVGLAGCVGEDPGDDGDDDSDGVVIGSNHPLSGDLGGTGTRMDNAVQLAAMIKNEDGGIESMDGAEIDVISGDNQGAQELGGEIADELVDDGADVLTGCFSSPVTNAAARAAESSSVPMVISVSVDDAILQENDLNYVYRPQPPAAQMAIDHADLMPAAVRDAGHDIETAAIYYIDIDFGQSVRDRLQEELPEQDIEVVETVSVDFGETVDTQVTQIQSADPDVVIAISYEAETVELVRAMDNQDYAPPFLTGCSNEALNDRSALESMGDTVEGALATNFALDPTNDRAAEVRERFEEEFDQSFDANVAMTYASTEVIIAAIEEAGSADPDDINDALNDIEVSDHIAAMPPISFDETGENENALAPLFQVQDLEDRVVAPEEFAESEIDL
ncbi:ABC transporter substrate-binding protein [Natronorubrum texcoconense]|uniref:Amino acid/amide ABC transporter substrate-binding protein, HAAT family n=1 Tax=Natronorubrum texcoconense TaxID=1095776 RepID=A0A1G9D2T3_9EURY|nr:ABC transporter substrate-binding protein [Natronorubrum texcoconense]SDK58133.1 amino acid/amide ABC transporter substrate-binding protein, HAAT family [Natronorubrum texcoconense]